MPKRKKPYRAAPPPEPEPKEMHRLALGLWRHILAARGVLPRDNEEESGPWLKHLPKKLTTKNP